MLLFSKVFFDRCFRAERLGTVPLELTQHLCMFKSALKHVHFLNTCETRCAGKAFCNHTRGRAGLTRHWVQLENEKLSIQYLAIKLWCRVNLNNTSKVRHRYWQRLKETNIWMRKLCWTFSETYLNMFVLQRLFHWPKLLRCILKNRCLLSCFELSSYVLSSYVQLKCFTGSKLYQYLHERRRTLHDLAVHFIKPKFVLNLLKAYEY